LELIDVQQKAKEDKQKEFLAKGIINEEEYQQSLAEIAENSDKKRIASYSDMLGTTTDNLRTALGEGNKMYKAFAIANAIMNTYQAAVAAYQSAAAIPIVGYIAGPVAAAAAVAAGLANVAKIRSAREQGGNLAAGQISTIAERGKAEVIMPAGASRVRTAQQMKQIMGENSSSNSVPNVQIVNQTTGRIDSATTEQDDEGRIVVLIRETVSADMQNSNSSISKSRRATRGQPGYA
jgi:SLT domain-containing protein